MVKKKEIKPKAVKTVKKVVAKKSAVSLEALFEAGAHFGHQARRWNPRMKNYIYGLQDGVHIFDLPKTKACLDEALAFLTSAKKEGKTILLVGTKKQAQEKIKEIALALNMPFINQRFLGGTFTNFNQIKKSITKLSQMKADMKNGVYDSYTKKEKLLLAREIDDLEKNFGGIANLTKLPDVVFIVDTHKENGAVMESNRLGIKIVGIVDSNANPDIIDYPIPMNDDANKALTYVLDLVQKALA